MNEQERREAIWRLYNPQTPDPFVSHKYGVLLSELPPRGTLREKVAALGWWGRYKRAQRRAAREAERARAAGEDARD
jgi:hypothetical protein